MTQEAEMAQQSSAVAVRSVSPLAVTDEDMAAIFERVVVGGDLSQLTAPERAQYYLSLCEAQRLDWRTKPFDFLELDKRLVLYANRNCTDQIRKRDDLSVVIVAREVIDGVCVVTARATGPTGRTDESIGAVALVKEGGKWVREDNRNVFKADGTLVPLRPEDRANAYMKAETKAKRRVTLSQGGLSMLDESEVEGIDERRVRRVQVDVATGEIRPPATIREIQPEPPAEGSIDVAGADVQSATTTKRSGVVQSDGRVVDRHTGEITAPPLTDALQEQTAKAIENQSKILSIDPTELEEIAIALLNVPDMASVTEEGGQRVVKLLTIGRAIRGAMVTSRLDKIAKDMEAEGFIENTWLCGLFVAKESELERKVAASETAQSGGR